MPEQNFDEKKQIINTRSFRISEENAAKITEIAKDLGVTQNGVFEELISAYNLQQDMEYAPEVSKDIESFISHLRSIQDAYHHIVSVNTQTEERVYQKFSTQLENDAEQIKELRAARDEQKDRITKLESDLAESTTRENARDKELSDALNLISERDRALQDKQTIIDSLNDRLPAQAEMDTKIASLEAETKRLGSLLSSSETERANLQGEADRLRSELSFAKKQAEQSAKEHVKEISSLEKSHKKDIEIAEKQAKADLKAAVAEARQEERDKAQEKQENMQGKIDLLQEKIEELRSVIDQQKETIAKLEKENAVNKGKKTVSQ